MPPLEWLRVSWALQQAGLPCGDDDAELAALALRKRKVPVIRDGGRWRVQADHPETVAWLAGLRQQKQAALRASDGCG